MLTVTTTFIGVLLLMQVGLSVTTSSYRAKLNIEYGDNGDLTMLKAIRAHGNFIEYVPIILIAMGAGEAAGEPIWLLVTSGCVLVLSRFSHAAHMLGYGGKTTRLLGAGLTTTLMGVIALYLLGRTTGLLA
jgi:hypothetical protein